jgi:aminoglycoside N3'-acetyltransferase
MDASVLYFGVNLDAATLLHTAEDAAGVPYIYKQDLCRSSVKYRDGTERTLEFRRHDLNIHRRFANIAPWLEERGLLHRKTFGNGELLFTPSSRAQHQALVGEMKRDPWFLTDCR